jgi:hypothetical protein
MTAPVERPESPQDATEAGWQWQPALLAFLLSVALTVAIVMLYHHRYAASGSYATVDIGSIVKERETQFAALLSKPDVRDQDRQAAFRLVQQLGPEIERSVDVLQQECKCTILVKSAVIAGPANDLTARLHEIMASAGDGK